MPPAARFVFSVLLLFTTVYCIYGFLATYESPGSPVLRGVYGALGVGAFLGTSWVVVRGK